MCTLGFTKCPHRGLVPTPPPLPFCGLCNLRRGQTHPVFCDGSLSDVGEVYIKFSSRGDSKTTSTRDASHPVWHEEVNLRLDMEAVDEKVMVEIYDSTGHRGEGVGRPGACDGLGLAERKAGACLRLPEGGLVLCGIDARQKCDSK